MRGHALLALAIVAAAGGLANGQATEGGAPIDVESFRVQRAVPDGPAGLVALTLDAAVLAESRGPAARFADLRIVDAAGRQVPYLVERREAPLRLDLAVEPFEPKARDLLPSPGRLRSVYRVRLPHRNLPPLRLELETSARVFQRNVQAGIERPADRHRREPSFDVLAGAIWQHSDEASNPSPLMLDVDAGGEQVLTLVVEEGDNRPLPIDAVRALLPSYRIRFYHPSGPLRLLYGRNDLGAPQYDLALLNAEVMGAAAREISAGPPQGAGGAEPAPLVSPRAFWLGLGAAVIVLLAVIARLLKQ